ncbi:hypothetical protein BDR03DRAFT_958909, partial [Suillus americanus]
MALPASMLHNPVFTALSEVPLAIVHRMFSNVRREVVVQVFYKCLFLLFLEDWRNTILRSWYLFPPSRLAMNFRCDSNMM